MTPEVPVSHSEFKYREPKNIYALKLKSKENLAFTDHAPERNRGNWRSQFSTNPPPNSPLHVEIGCNAGHVITALAAQNPKVGYIGIDWKWKAIYRAVEKTEKKNLKNLLFIRAHAERLTYLFGPQEIDLLSIFFPDPWPKKSQQKNRYLTGQQFQIFAELIRPGGVLHIKTDHPNYFEMIINEFKSVSNQWKILSLTKHLYAGHPHPHLLQIPEVTLFERVFIREGLPIHELMLMRETH